MPLAQILGHGLRLLRGGSVVGDLVSLISSEDLNYVALLGELDAVLVGPLPEPPVRRAHAARLAVIEGVGAALLLHVLHFQIGIAAQSCNALLEKFGRLLSIGVLLRSD